MKYKDKYQIKKWAEKQAEKHVDFYMDIYKPYESCDMKREGFLLILLIALRTGFEQGRTVAKRQMKAKS